MFHLRGPGVAMACVVLCLVQLALDGLLLVHASQGDMRLVWRWHVVDTVATLVLGTVLVLRLPRDLQWRPRRSKRASREVLLERQRIARDLHDHVGSRIVAVMSLLDAHDPASRPLAQALDQCLLELRLVVDSMDGDDDVLPGRLARLRHRLQPALERQGIALHWHVAPAPDLEWPSGDSAREFAAVAQEAVSNVLQHAHASELTVALQPLPEHGPGAWRLQVHDNGAGLQDADSTGQGLLGMRRRCERLGAQFEMLPGPAGGVCVRVTMPAAVLAGPRHAAGGER